MAKKKTTAEQEIPKEKAKEQANQNKPEGRPLETEIESEKKTKVVKDDFNTQAETNIGTVGHVDHGKTTLVEALSGEWTDRYSEEQRKGISIKLGYANTNIGYCPHCDIYTTYHLSNKLKPEKQKRNTCHICGAPLTFKRKISFVDSPGHEILMATMLSGASLMDGALLLISALEHCPQPQTREHLAALSISGIKNIIIVQNKVDAVTRQRALENFREIKQFIKGTVAENAPIIPVSSIYRLNLEEIIKYIEKLIPTPKLDETKTPRFHIARSFDVNKPGKPIADLNGGVIGGSISQGQLKVGDRIELRPGFKKGEKYIPLVTTVKSLYQGNIPLNVAKPGGLIGVGTELDPSLTKADNLTGNLAGFENQLPPVQNECDIKITLLDKVLGAEEVISVSPLKPKEPMMIVIGTTLTSGIVQTIGKKNIVHFMLKRPICAEKGSTVALSRLINRRYRLIGYGTLES